LVALSPADIDAVNPIGYKNVLKVYERYHETAQKQEKKQVARDAYAAGMGEQARYMRGED